MTKVDQRADVPRVDAVARERLAVALDREPVAAAYLFGSQATGAPGPLSDVDVAVALTAHPGEATPDVGADLVAAAIDALGTDEVDLVLSIMRRRCSDTAYSEMGSCWSTATLSRGCDSRRGRCSTISTPRRCATSWRPAAGAVWRRDALVDAERIGALNDLRELARVVQGLADGRREGV